MAPNARQGGIKGNCILRATKGGIQAMKASLPNVHLIYIMYKKWTEVKEKWLVNNHAHCPFHLADSGPPHLYIKKELV